MPDLFRIAARTIETAAGHGRRLAQMEFAFDDVSTAIQIPANSLNKLPSNTPAIDIANMMAANPMA